MKNMRGRKNFKRPRGSWPITIVPTTYNADSRPRQLRPRPKAPQQIKNFPTKKRPHLP